MSWAARSVEWGHMGYGPPFWAWHPGWIILMVLGFIFWWPAGLAILAYTLWSRRMACWGQHGYDHWQAKYDRWQAKMERMRDKMERFGHGGWGPSSGNRAFDDYRTETLRRLEEEQREFREFLQRLRMAKDKAEFDQFMAERRNRPASAPPPPPPQA
jgi:Protein of unknown function (DUF2852)